MDHINPHGVRFRIRESGQNIEARYYTPKDKWPKTYRSFRCVSDEDRREMFFMINSVRLCSTCERNTLGYRDDPDCTNCSVCCLRESATPDVDEISECPVCYNKMLGIDATRRTLACKHNVCLACFRRLHRVTHYMGPTSDPVGPITCPLCRHEAYYSSRSLRQVDGRGFF